MSASEHPGGAGADGCREHEYAPIEIGELSVRSTGALIEFHERAGSGWIAATHTQDLEAMR